MEGFVLGGGHSSRMGVDKARVAFPGHWPLAVEVARVLRKAGVAPARLVRRGSETGPWPPELPVLREPDHPDRHPLYGVAAALEAATGSLALVVSCDLPWLTPAAVEALTSAEGPCVAMGERMQPLVAVWPTMWAERVAEHAAAGGSARSLASELPVVEVDPACLRDLDDWRAIDHAWPVDALMERLTFLEPTALERVRRGEIARLWARGALDPSVDIQSALADPR